MNCVVDASVAASWFITDEHSKLGEVAFQEYSLGHLEFQVPILWNFEIQNVITMCLRHKRLNEEGWNEAMDLLNEIRCHWHDQTEPYVRRRIFNFAKQYRLTAYDAAYLELAERLATPLLTQDKSLVSAARKLKVPTRLN